MTENLEKQILEFIENRQKKGDSTASRHIHIRFGLEITEAEKILGDLTEKTRISKFYDKDYQEDRFTTIQ